MIVEAFSIPILLKATNFLFDEVGKILQERRERRQAEQKSLAQETDTISSLSTREDEQRQDIITSKDAALKQRIDKNAWQSSEAEVEHLLSLLEIHTQNYYLAKEQYAKWGSALVPPIIVNNLTEAEDEVAKTTRKLQDTLSKIYGKQFTILEVE
jgi:hypothetical protein